MKKFCILMMFVVLIILCWLTRFSIYPIDRASTPSAYKLDRWTGKVTFYLLYKEHPVEKTESESLFRHKPED